MKGNKKQAWNQPRLNRACEASRKQKLVSRHIRPLNPVFGYETEAL